jgi:hypothetical protein
VVESMNVRLATALLLEFAVCEESQERDLAISFASIRPPTTVASHINQ